jgi:hypothetical protein
LFNANPSKYYHPEFTMRQLTASTLDIIDFVYKYGPIQLFLNAISPDTASYKYADEQERLCLGRISLNFRHLSMPQ